MNAQFYDGITVAPVNPDELLAREYESMAVPTDQPLARGLCSALRVQFN